MNVAGIEEARNVLLDCVKDWDYQTERDIIATFPYRFDLFQR